MVVVVDFFDFDTRWHRARAICASDGSEFVLSNFEQLLDNEFADSTASLSRGLLSSFIMERLAGTLEILTYPNDSNFLHMIFGTLRLLASILLGHDVGWTMVAETGKCTVIVSGESGSAWLTRELGMGMKNVKKRSEFVKSRQMTMAGKQVSFSYHKLPEYYFTLFFSGDRTP